MLLVTAALAKKNSECNDTNKYKYNYTCIIVIIMIKVNTVGKNPQMSDIWCQFVQLLRRPENHLTAAHLNDTW